MGYDDLEVKFRFENGAGNPLTVSHPLGTSNPLLLSFDISDPQNVTGSVPASIANNELVFNLSYSTSVPTDSLVVIKYSMRGRFSGENWNMIYLTSEFISEVCSDGPGVNVPGSGERFGQTGELEKFIVISPKAFTNSLSFQLKGEFEHPLELMILDLNGRSLATTSISPENVSSQWDLSHLTNGYYFLKVRDGKGFLQVDKLVKID